MANKVKREIYKQFEGDFQLQFIIQYGLTIDQRLDLSFLLDAIDHSARFGFVLYFQRSLCSIVSEYICSM